MDMLTDELVLATTIRSVGSASFLPELLEYMRDITPFRGAFIVILTKNSGPEHVFDNVREERRSIVVDRWLDKAWSLDPYVSAYLNDQYKDVMTVKEVAPDRFSQSEFYATYYSSVRLRDELAIFVEIGGSTLFFSLGRLVGENKFSRRDIARLQRAHPIISALCQKHFYNRSAKASSRVGQDDVIKKLGNELTARELDIVGLILRGHSSRSIASRLDLSIETVKVHRKNVYRKLGISSQSALFSLFLQVS